MKVFLLSHENIPILRNSSRFPQFKDTACRRPFNVVPHWSMFFFFPNPRAYPKFCRLGGVAGIVIISSYMETLNHAVYRDWLHFCLPPYTREKKQFGHCWDRTRAACMASDRFIHYSMALRPHWSMLCSPFTAVDYFWFRTFC